MKFSTRGRYAIRASMCLALKYGQGPVSLKKISENQGISAKYLENIMRVLVSAGIAYSTKGKNGGFVLAKDPKNITVFDVLKISEGSLLPVDCLESTEKCSRAGLCATRDMWMGLRDVMTEYLKGITIDGLAKGQSDKFGKAGKKTPCL